VTNAAARRARGVLVLALTAAVGACSKADKAPPVATVSFSVSKSRIALGSPLDMTYKFDVAPTAKIAGDYRVFVHLVDADGVILPWYDDHDPPVPTSQWKPGQTIQYTRTQFLPIVPYIGACTVQVGLYRGDQRLPLSGPNAADRTSMSRSYTVGTLQLLPQSENIFLVPKAGWNPTEFAAENPSRQWQWTEKAGVLSLKNPQHDVWFYLEFDARPDVFDHPQQVTIYSGTRIVTTFSADNNGPVIRRIPVTAAQLGTSDPTDLRIEVDRTFVPAKLPNGGRDSRELGIRVYHTFVEPR
jgi:hypothetical protein